MEDQSAHLFVNQIDIARNNIVDAHHDSTLDVSVSDALLLVIELRSAIDNFFLLLSERYSYFTHDNDNASLLRCALALAKTPREAYRIERYCLEYADDENDEKRGVAFTRALELSKHKEDVEELIIEVIISQKNLRSEGEMIDLLVSHKEWLYAALQRYTELPDAPQETG